MITAHPAQARSSIAIAAAFWRRLRALGLVGLALLWAAWCGPAAAVIQPPPGGPVLVIQSGNTGFGPYYAEILRNEGFNLFSVADIGEVSASMMAAYDVIILAKTSALSPQRVTELTAWVNNGGSLIAIAPDAQLAPLLGITPANQTLANAYLRIDTGSGPGSGLTGETLQFHGSADRYALSGATAIATLYSDAGTPTANPAVTLRRVGAGNAAAFTYDLATSIVTMRQGNPAWAAQERDGMPPIRSDDKFYGTAATDPQPDWVDMQKFTIPQADEQQRLLANLMLEMNQGRQPLPRFWYFPKGKKAVVVMTGDDHGNGGTAGRFDQLAARSPAGCSVADWECLRATSYIYDYTPLSNAQAASYAAAGFEVGIHINTGCADYTAASLSQTYAQQIAAWRAKYTDIALLGTQRHHCIVWSDWASGATTQLANGMRLDTSYYTWPPGWINNVPGYLTGSAMPMRFSASDGSLIDVYLAVTQMTDESGQSYPFTPNAFLDRALGAEGYYGAFTVNAHTDSADNYVSDDVVASALARGVPVVSAQQLLTWLDARNASSFGAMAWANGTLAFTLQAASGANNLQGMLPTRWGSRMLLSLTRGGAPVATTSTSIKGRDYAFFKADGGNYVASYGVDTTQPTVAGTTPASGATNVATGIKPTITFSEAMDAASVLGAFGLNAQSGGPVAASVAYDPATRTATLTPSAALAGNSVYVASLLGGAQNGAAKDEAGNPVAPLSWSFTTAEPVPPPNCPCSTLPATAVPGTPSFPDGGAVELGVRFRSDVAGYVTGVRFYKGASNSGQHIGNLWTASGQRLATVSFSGETASGWQQASFDNPVPITANTVYVVSYYAPNGGYAADAGYFATSGVDLAPLHLLQDGVAGGNGLYAYGSTSGFPSSSYNSTNYWVDPVFTITPPADTSPPKLLSTTPANGASGTSTLTNVTAVFDEPLDAATVNASTFSLSGPAGAIAATVSYSSATRTASLMPSAPLALGTTYTATVRGGAVDPRLKDMAGNALAASASWSFTTTAQADACTQPANPIVAENCLPGTPASEWQISGAGSPGIQGFATQISVNRGETIDFKVDTDASSYRFDIYRMGWYGGAGARRVATVQPSASLPQAQPNCLNDAATGLVDCGNWGVSGSWTVPSTAPSGIYFAAPVRSDNGDASHIFFIVRNDAGNSAMVFQTSDTTWQAYNDWGGQSLYTGGPGINPGRAYKVSYNRPFRTREVDNGQDWVFNAEYPMVRWLESNGYDVSYIAGADPERAPALLRNHEVFLSVGHDEYWTAGQRAAVEAARDAGVHLAFFSGNEVFWKARWENSMDGSGTPRRTLVCYKETHANAKIDPSGIWTGTWRDPRFSPPADGGRPENALTGTLPMVNAGATTAVVVPAADGRMRFWRNTSVAALTAGNSATLAPETLGYEWDTDVDNGARPAGLFHLSTTTVANAPILLDQGSTWGSGPATNHLSLYRHSSGALVFGTGSVQWSWGLDAAHDRGNAPADPRMQQATLNLFADMGVQPGTLQPGLVAATASTDTTAPASTIGAPAAGGSVAPGATVTISGSASDSGGGVVAGVEVSTDNGATWHPASGRESWSWTWTAPTANGTVTLRSRAVDDTGNLQTAATSITVTVGAADTTAPVSAIASPTAGSIVTAGAAVTISGTASDSGGSGVARVEVSVNGGTSWSTASGTGPWSFAWTAPSTAGTVTLRSRAIDGSGNVQTTASSVSVTVQAADTTPPTSAISLPAAGAVIPLGAAVTISGTASDTGGSGVARVEVSVNGGSTWASASGTGPWSFAWTAPSTAATVTLRSRAVDGRGNVQTTASSVSVTVRASDTTRPTSAITSPTAGAIITTGAAVTIGGTASDSGGSGVARVEVSVNGGTTWASASGIGPWSFAWTAPATAGTVTLRSRAVDGSGNVQSTASSVSVTVRAPDTTPPTSSIGAPAANAVIAGGSAVTISGTASDSGGGTVAGVEVSVDGGTSWRAASGTTSWSYAWTAPTTAGTVTLRSRARDSSGNLQTAVTSRTVTVSTADITPPTITARSPAPNATNVARNTTVTVTFSEAMTASTINGNTIQLRNALTNSLVSATVSWNATTRTATLDPASNLSPLSSYTVTVRGGTAEPRVKDAAGNALGATSSWTFRARLL